MHPPSAPLLRALRSSLAHRPTPRHVFSRQQSIIPRASITQANCPVFTTRCLSTSAVRHRRDDSDSNPRNPPPQPPPPSSSSSSSPPRRFDLSTADLKAGLRDRRKAAAADAAKAEKESKSESKSDSSESREGIDERPGTTGGASPTDLSSFDMFADVAAPTTAIDACLADGFHLNNGVKVGGGDGCLLVDGEVFRWRPWEAILGDGDNGMVNAKGQWEVPEEVWGLFGLVWPKPGEFSIYLSTFLSFFLCVCVFWLLTVFWLLDLLVLGLGESVRPLSPETRRHINELGMRIEVLDTRNAAAQFNLLATERGLREVAAALVPMGRRA